MSCPNLIVDTVTITPQESRQLRQTYQQPQAQYRARATDGTMITQDAGWQTMTIVISGQGMIPPGLQDIDYKSSFTVKCMTPRRAVGSVPAFETVRADQANETWSMKNNIFVPESGGSPEYILYWPEYVVHSMEGVRETTGTIESYSHDWELICETIDPL